jgi:nucleoside-diphosphate-sugar epimerase
MRAVVTGAAGFIGSRLTEVLQAEGAEVSGVDAFTPYYDRALKESNTEVWRAAGAPLLELDLRSADLRPVLDGAEVVHHLAAQPGVRASWGAFEDYATHNLVATQRVLEAAREVGVRRVVVASSSSVYGNATSYPTREDDALRPHSPYGVTKRAVEDLCRAHVENWGTETVLLRYFTVYGPRQRPDMAFHRLLEAALGGGSFPLYGDGSARRDFTYVDDAVAATVAAGTADLEPGTVLNVAGGDESSMAGIFDLVADLVGAPVALDRRPAQPGDVDRTGGDTGRAARLLGYAPTVDLRTGLERQLAWHRARSAAAGA